MNRSIAVPGVVVLVVLSLTACKPKAATAPDAPPAGAATPTVFEIMTKSFTPHSNKLWELAGNLYGDNGELDAGRLTDLQWQELSAAAVSIRDNAMLLTGAPTVRVAADGARLMNDGTPGALGVAGVQALIDGDLVGFKDEASRLAAVAGDAVTAVSVRDAAKLDVASNRLNDVCTSCHNRYWYPNQPEQ